MINDLEAIRTPNFEILTLERTNVIRAQHAAGLEWAISLAFGAPTVGKRYIERAGVAGTLAYCYPTSPNKIDFFAKQLRDGENIAKTDPAYALRTFIEQLLAQHGTAHSSGDARHVVSVLTLRAVMAAIKGEQLSVLKPGLLTGNNFYKDACRYFARAHVHLAGKHGVVIRKRSA